MKPEQLSAETQKKLDELLTAVEKVLATKPSPHLHAVSESSMPDGATPNDVLKGGSIKAPSKPPFDYDEPSVGNLHRAVLQSGDGVLFGLIIHAERPSPEGKWTLTTKLVSRQERRQLESSRKAIDDEVERELRRLTEKAGWQRVSFGRDMPKKQPRLVRDSGSGLERLDPDPRLLALLGRAEVLYRQAGFDLIVADWTLRSGGLTFREYVE